jgi:hypothetical protein
LGFKQVLCFYFFSEKKINDGILLPVDIILVNDAMGQEILKIGPEDWFVSEKRKTLVSDKEIIHLALKSGEYKKRKYVILNNDVNKAIIYADYDSQYSRKSQQIIIYPSYWKYYYYINAKKENIEQIEILPQKRS